VTATPTPATPTPATPTPATPTPATPSRDGHRTVSLGITLGGLNPKSWREVALAADETGIESVFVSDHLVAPVQARGSLGTAEKDARMQPDTPLLDSLGYLSYLAGITERVRLGTYVYLLGLRHPFAAARAVATLDVVSGGRALFGVGAGWLTSEFEAAQVPSEDRGRRLDESIGLCRRLWSEERIAHRGEFYSFGPVGFRPKPARLGGVPLLVGGESAPALRRAARLGDGWIGMRHTQASAAAKVTTLRRLRAEAGRGPDGFTITVGGDVRDRSDLDAWAAAGVDRVVVQPWAGSRTAAADLRDFADAVLR
jgi:probable F420-dependent oxidoreductase